MQQTITLAAGQRTTVQIAGRQFLILSTGAAASVELWVMRGTFELEHVRTAPRGFKAATADGLYSHVDLLSTVDTVAEVVVSAGAVDFDFITGTNVQATIVGQPVQVSNDRGTPGNLLYVSGVSISDAPATSAPDGAAVACGPAQAQILAADSTRRQVTFTNIGADPVALGSTGITWAKRCIVIAAGDSYIETRAANLAWFGITDAAKAGSVTTKAVLA